MDLFSRKLSPMLIGASGAPFDADDYLYELKFDGIRCVAYIEEGRVQLRNKRALDVTQTYPELASIVQQAKSPCILDGELVIFRDGRPAFADIQRRALMTDPFRISLAAQKVPAYFVAFDILFAQGMDTMHRPLHERKAMLFETVKEGNLLILSRVIEGKGKALYALAEQQQLEGIVAKRKASLYYPGKRTKEWIKSKILADEDFVIVGYITKAGGMNSLILGQYQDGSLIYQGHVTLGVSGESFRRIRQSPKTQAPPFPVPAGNEHAVWLSPQMVCSVQYMERTASGAMRQPTFKGLRDDKAPEDCLAKNQI